MTDAAEVELLAYEEAEQERNPLAADEGAADAAKADGVQLARPVGRKQGGKKLRGGRRFVEAEAELSDEGGEGGDDEDDEDDGDIRDLVSLMTGQVCVFVFASVW